MTTSQGIDNIVENQVLVYYNAKMTAIIFLSCIHNRLLPSSLVPLFQSESKCETILREVTLISMKMKLRAELIFIRMVSHLDSLCNRGTRELELGNGLFHHPFPANGDNISQWM